VNVIAKLSTLLASVGIVGALAVQLWATVALNDGPLPVGSVDSLHSQLFVAVILLIAPTLVTLRLRGWGGVSPGTPAKERWRALYDNTPLWLKVLLVCLLVNSLANMSTYFWTHSGSLDQDAGRYVLDNHGTRTYIDAGEAARYQKADLQALASGLLLSICVFLTILHFGPSSPSASVASTRGRELKQP